MQQENRKTRDDQQVTRDVPEQPELSTIWQELLGLQPESLGSQSNSPQDGLAIDALTSDPWSELLHVRGIEVVDLQQLHLHMSDQDVEQVLQVMQEQSALPLENQPGSSPNKKSNL